jgi:hypothetical protein
MFGNLSIGNELPLLAFGASVVGLCTCIGGLLGERNVTRLPSEEEKKALVRQGLLTCFLNSAIKVALFYIFLKTERHIFLVGAFLVCHLERIYRYSTKKENEPQVSFLNYVSDFSSLITISVFALPYFLKRGIMA